MSLKIFHIADVHIGMKFTRYPQDIRLHLIDARFDALAKAVEQANQRQTDLFVIGGDLFESLSVSQQDLNRVSQILSDFHGAEILILPGNHDYHQPDNGFWEKFSKKLPDHGRILSEMGRTDLEVREYSLSVFSAPCDKKHSQANPLDFMETEAVDPNRINILIAHGAINELTIDLNNNYFPMSMEDLQKSKVDLCLTGHTHVPYPMAISGNKEKIFNPGTPEPDGMNYRYGGFGFYLEIDRNKNIQFEKIPLGKYRFVDEEWIYQEGDNWQTVLSKYQIYDPKNLLLRLTIKGYMEKEDYEQRNDWFDALKKHLAYFAFDDSNLKVRFTESLLDKEFQVDSLPYLFLKNVLEREDENTAHLAYELMKEVREVD